MDMAQLLARNENLTEAKFYYKLECMLHEIEDSCNMLGFLYEPENQYISEAYFSLTCHNGHEYGCRALVSHAAQSNQVDKARSLAKLACQYEGEKACVARGIDVYKNNNIQEAEESFKRNCDQKNAEGYIGACLISAEEGKRKQAKKFLQKACPDSSTCGIEVKKLSSQEMKEACKLDMTKEWSYWPRADFNQTRIFPLLRKR